MSEALGGGGLKSSNMGAPEGSGLFFLLVSHIPLTKAATSSARAPMAIPAIAPPPSEEEFFDGVETEEGP